MPPSVASVQDVEVYQVRAPFHERPHQAAESLASAVSAAVRRVTEGDGIHPRVWAGLYYLLRNAFRRRLYRHEACGRTTRCAEAVPESVFWDPAGRQRLDAHVLLLDVRGDAARFVWSLTALVKRQVLRASGERPSDPVSFNVRVAAAIRTALADRLFFSGSCRCCPVRYRP